MTARARIAVLALCVAAALVAACSDSWREGKARAVPTHPAADAPPDSGPRADAPDADLAGHHPMDLGQDATPWTAPEEGFDEAMEAIDHPLVRGRLTGPEAEARLAEFARDWERAHDEDTGTVWVFRKYLEDLGVARIAHHFEARKPGCHGELHNLGKVVADLTGDAATAMAVCGDACTYACIHGALKAHYAARAEGDGGVARARTDLISLCTGGTLIGGFYRGNCAHAAGHAFAIMATDVHAALELCGTFPDREYAYYCATGVFMQVTPRLRRSLDAQAGDAEEARVAARLAYCRGVTRYLGACVRFLMRDRRGEEDLQYLADACDTMAGEDRLGCFNALGYLGRSHVAREPGWINTLCGRGGPEDRVLCISGFALAKQGNAMRPRIEAACGALTDPELGARCREQFGRHYYALGNPILMRML